MEQNDEGSQAPATGEDTDHGDGPTEARAVGASWVEGFTREHAKSERHMAFLDANRWQRDAVELKATGMDGFLVLAGLLFVLLLENLWSFDPQTFGSAAASDGVLAMLVLGAACGIFSIFSVTLVRLKLQRLLARDVACLNAQQTGQAPIARYDRLVKQWKRSADTNQFHHACLAYEWYHGARPECKTPRNPARPRILARYAVLSFVVMLAASGATLGIKVADVKGVGWGVFSCVLMAGGVVVPAACMMASVRDPPMLSESEDNPFYGY